MKIHFTSWFLVFSFFTTVSGQDNLKKFFGHFEGTIVIYDSFSDQFTVVNKTRATQRFSPFSTFKIPNSIIALEAGILQDAHTKIHWDTNKYPAQDWWPDSWKGEHDLGSAIKFSVVPIYRHLATQIGATKMKKYVEAFNYGNRDISSGLDSFWLNGSLEISAFEQITFLRSFFNNKLNITPQTQKIVKRILVQESTETYSLSGKTGGGYLDAEHQHALGWFVGYIEKADNVFFFALNIDGSSFSAIQKPRLEITRNILKEVNIIP